MILKQIDRFIQNQKTNGKSANTLKNYRTDLTCFYNYLIERHQSDNLSNFTLEHTLQYGRYLSCRFTADNSRRRRVQTLRIFFDYLVMHAIIQENWARKIPVSPKHLSLPQPTPYQHIYQVWQYLSSPSPTSALETLMQLRNQILFLLIYTGALKVATLSTLKMEQITVGPKPRVLLFPTKGDPYTVPLHPSFSNIFLRYKNILQQQQEHDCLFFSEVFFYANPHKLISGGISPRGIELVFKEIRNKLKLEVFTPKSLRTATIYAWLHARNNEETIKHWLGVAPSYSLAPFQATKNNNLHSFIFL